MKWIVFAMLLVMALMQIKKYIDSAKESFTNLPKIPKEHNNLGSKRRALKPLTKAWLPDGYSQILRSYVFGPSGFWTMAPLRCAAKFDPFLSLDCTPTPSTLVQSKERKGSNFAIWQPCLQVWRDRAPEEGAQGLQVRPMQSRLLHVGHVGQAQGGDESRSERRPNSQAASRV